jgi:hypothetical protein
LSPLEAKWERLGRLIAPSESIGWMTSHCGGSFAEPTSSASVFRLLITGRDRSNRSLIGTAKLDLTGSPAVRDVGAEPVFTPGTLGAFDENGVSYPCLVKDAGRTLLLYTGWMPTVLTPFQNQLGLAEERDGRFVRVSRAPLLDRNDDDYLSIGSSFALIENGLWRLWYTSFTGWENSPTGAKHRYLIKYAESGDGRVWKRPGTVCIGPDRPEELSIARPSVLKAGETYHMWFCSRGDVYRIGYARSKDGIRWTRSGALALSVPENPREWDGQSQCYPHAFAHAGSLYLLYSGNEYGRGGLGIARLPLSALEELP